MFNGEAFGREMVSVVKDYVDRATAPLHARISTLEAVAPQHGEPGPQGRGIASAEIRNGLLILRLTDDHEIVVGDVKGADGAPPDLEAINATIRGVVKEVVTEAVTDLELPQGEQGERGEPGAAGATPEAVAEILLHGVTDFDDRLKARVDEAVSALTLPQGERGEQGQPGEDGISPEPEVIAELMVDTVKALVDEVVAALPLQQGEQGDPGPRGEPGRDGISPEPEQVAEAMAGTVKSLVEEAVAALPLQKGDPGERGERGEPGKDGRGLAACLIDRNGHLIATFSDGSTADIGPVLGRDGTDGKDGERGHDGKDGRDGFNLDDFDVNMSEDGRTIILSFAQGEQRFDAELKFPAPIYRGVFKAEDVYEPGDLVTWGGSLWHCDAKTSEKPEAGPWRLCVRKGRDGKDGKDLIK